MLELARYVYRHYPLLRDKVQLWQLLSLLDRNQDKIAVVKEGDCFIGSALFARVSDETLWKLEYGFMDLTNQNDVEEILKDNGLNLHFLYVLASGGQRTIRRGLKEVIEKENPKTVSWFNPRMTKLNKFILKGRAERCLR